MTGSSPRLTQIGANSDSGERWTKEFASPRIPGPGDARILRAVTQLHGQWRGWRRSPGGTQRERRESHTLLHARLVELHGRLNFCKAAEVNFRRALERAQVGPEQSYLARMGGRAKGTETVNQERAFADARGQTTSRFDDGGTGAVASGSIGWLNDAARGQVEAI